MGKIFEFLREYGLALLVGAVGLSCFGYGLWQVIAPPPVVVEISRDTDAESRVATQLVVDVSGAVVNPGVYTLAEGSRVGRRSLPLGDWLHLLITPGYLQRSIWLRRLKTGRRYTFRRSLRPYRAKRRIGQIRLMRRIRQGAARR